MESPHRDGKLTLIKGSRMHNREKIISSRNDLGKTGYSHVKNAMKLDPYLTLYTKIQSNHFYLMVSNQNTVYPF